MREQLIRYVDLLFAGAADADDIKQEILQNTLDRYDDLVSQGKAPEAAYSLAISGIGEISEILNTSTQDTPVAPVPETQVVPGWKKILRAAAIFLYIIAAIPLFVLSELGMEIIGLCGTIAIVAVATVLIILSGSGRQAHTSKPQSELGKAINSVIFTVGLCGYFIISFASGAWHITWLMFPIIFAGQGLASAIIDLKEAC